jgi:SPP1 family phage portal protein
LSLIDAGNAIESDRQDGLEQFIQGFIKFVNCEISEEELKKFLALGAIMVNGHEGKQADVDYVATDLSQTDTQVMSDNIYNMILTICGMPNRNGGNSTSDTGSAVIYRDGWQNAESRALAIENMFKGAEIQILKVLLKILKEKTISGVSDDVRRAIDNLSLNDIDIQFTRRNTSNLQSKVQVLIQMLSEPKVHPRLAYEISDLFTDPENAYKQGMEYYQETLNTWNIDEGSGDKKITSEEDI